MKKASIIATLLVMTLITACASSPKKISTAYVSPLKYKDYDCDQIAMEMDHVGRRTTELFHSLKKDAKADKWQMGIGLILFWPTLFLLEGGDGPEATEYAQLKGEYNALREVAVSKKCDLTQLPAPPEEIIKSQDDKAKKDKPSDK